DGSENGSSLDTTATSGLSAVTTVAPAATSTSFAAGPSTLVTAVAQEARAKRTVLRGNGNDTVTIMVYMCATDLESQSGMATADLNEILYAEDSGKVNVVIETGGCTGWRNSVISSKTNQRYYVTAQGLQLLEGNLGMRSMVNPATLADFIQYSKAKYPADRYMLVMWDHGGGSLTGYGYDQHFKNDSMTLDELATALKNGGCTFDVIGFDACLMATLETAMVLEPYADYMVASEETEPGIGWYYTGWLTSLTQNTSLPTTDLGKKLIDDYVATCKSKTPQSQATLSLIDLAELKGTVPNAFASFASSTDGLIDTDSYQTVSSARGDAKEFAASSQINQIDLIHFAENLGTPEARAFANVLRGCIKYNRTSSNISNANGVSIYFPSSRLSQLDSMLSTYERIGIASEYSECIRSYASLAAGGQVTSSGSGNMLDSLLGGLLGGGAPSSGAGSGSSGAGAVGALLEAFLGGRDFSKFTGSTDGSPGWLDVDQMQSAVAYLEDNRFDASALAITEKNGQRVIALSDEQWKLVQHMELNVFLDDGEGFIDLGLDNVYEYNDDGDLVMEYDGTWLALNGQIVSYYMVSDDHDGDAYSIKGRVPALLNDQLVDIIVVFTNENPDGVVLGAQVRYDEATETGTVARGLLDIVAGDKIDYLCDYYTYEGEYNDTYYLGDQYTATGEWTVENLPVGDNDYRMTYRFTDIYGNQYWTESISG
ncbi:MAG: peptidase C11, partial [Thermoleophilia bacterium]|nr:peptidase C11 [Thermoleophilia bacterium]